MDTIDLISDNRFLVKTANDNSSGNIIVSLLNIKTNLDDFIKEFINIKTIPYVNTEYSYLLSESIDELDEYTKIELNAILAKYLEEIDSAIEKQINNSDEYLSLTEEQKASYLSSVKGGQYAEMLLMNILIDLGYEKILSKLYLEVGEGNPTPTLIDVPCIKDKSLVLGECKIFKNIHEAIESAVNDINNIVNKDKFDSEIREWQRKIKQIPESVKKRILDLKVLEGKDAFVNNLDEVVAFGFVMGNENKQQIKEQLLKNPLPISENIKYRIYLLMVPVTDKKVFLLSCYKAIKDILKLEQNDN